MLKETPRACACDGCAAIVAKLSVLELATTFHPGSLVDQTLLSKLRSELSRHRNRAEVGRHCCPVEGDERQCITSAFAANPENRPWLSYDPDALLPNPFDAFLLSGAIWPPLGLHNVANPSFSQDVDLDIRLCFVVGCGRSGTTALAECLSNHPDVVFLNEPRQLWISELASMDVWSTSAPSRQGRLQFCGNDVTDDLADRVVRIWRFLAELAIQRSNSVSAGTLRGKRKVLVLEKFPEHAFRISFLAELCERVLGPDRCCFIHVVRNGVDVARSIRRFNNPSAWYGTKGEQKWRCLREFMDVNRDEHWPREIGDGLVARVDGLDTQQKLFSRGLVEWALSIHFARSSLQDLGDFRKQRLMEVRYEDLVVNPEGVLASLENFIELPACGAVSNFAKSAIRKRSPCEPTNSELIVLRSARGSLVEQLLIKEFGFELPKYE